MRKSILLCMAKTYKSSSNGEWFRGGWVHYYLTCDITAGLKLELFIDPLVSISPYLPSLPSNRQQRALAIACYRDAPVCKDGHRRPEVAHMELLILSSGKISLLATLIWD